MAAVCFASIFGLIFLGPYLFGPSAEEVCNPPYRYFRDSTIAEISNTGFTGPIEYDVDSGRITGTIANYITWPAERLFGLDLVCARVFVYEKWVSVRSYSQHQFTFDMDTTPLVANDHCRVVLKTELPDSHCKGYATVLADEFVHSY